MLVQTDRSVRVVSTVLAAGVLAAGLLQAADGFEPAPTVKSADVLPAALLKGAKHEVLPTAKGDGFLLAFQVKSAFGTWDAVDREMLEVRVKEVYSLDKLSEVSKGEVFAKAFADSAKQKADAVAKVVDDPVGTAKAIPGGVARFAKGVGRATKGAVDSVAANKSDAPDDRSTTDKAADAAVAGADAAGDALVASKKREWAEQVGADPYTTNKPLSEKLDDFAWAAYAGGFALNVAMPPIPGLGAVTTTDRLVYQMPPAELQKRNDEKLKAAGVSDAARKALFVNRNFTATLQTQMAEAVAALGGATGTSEVVALAAESQTEGDARYMRRCVQLLAAGAKEVGGWKALTVSKNEIEAVGGDGRLVLPWSVDYMTWNAETVPEETAPVKAAKTKEVWITGVSTDTAKKELQARGFAVREKRALK